MPPPGLLRALPPATQPHARADPQAGRGAASSGHVRDTSTTRLWHVGRLVEDCVGRGERYIRGMHPHGVVPLQVLLWVAFADQYLRTAEHGTVYGFGGMASVICYLPGLRTLMGW